MKGRPMSGDCIPKEEIEITPEMIGAGVRALEHVLGDERVDVFTECYPRAARVLFLAMIRIWLPKPGLGQPKT